TRPPRARRGPQGRRRCRLPRRARLPPRQEAPRRPPRLTAGALLVVPSPDSVPSATDRRRRPAWASAPGPPLGFLRALDDQGVLQCLYSPTVLAGSPSAASAAPQRGPGEFVTAPPWKRWKPGAY